MDNLISDVINIYVNQCTNRQIVRMHTMVKNGKHQQIGGLEQDCSNSIANALELQQACSKPSKWWMPIYQQQDQS